VSFNTSDYYKNAELVHGTSYFTVPSTYKEGFQVVPTLATIEYAQYDRDRYGD
jgi:hypothetical protein